MQQVICRQIRTAVGGYIVELCWPYGGEPSGYGEVLCTSWEEVLSKLSEAAGLKDPAEGEFKSDDERTQLPK